MENHTQSRPESQRFKVNTLTLIFLVVVAMLVAGTSVYYWQNSKVTKLNSRVSGLSDEVVNLKQQIVKTMQAAQNASNTSTLSSDEQVIAAVKAYCNASVEPTTKQPLVLTVGKAGASQKQVLYSSDKNFAYVNAVCSKTGATEGSGAAYYLKNVNSTWVFLYRGQMASSEYTAQFNIPNDFN